MVQVAESLWHMYASSTGGCGPGLLISGTPRQSGSSSFPASLWAVFPANYCTCHLPELKIAGFRYRNGGGGGGREMTELVKGGWGGGLNLFWGGQWGRKLGLFECE